MFSNQSIRIVAVCLLGMLSGLAEPEPKSARHVRFLAVGDSPPFRQEIRDGVRYELDPPPGSIPPRRVLPGFGEELSDAVSLRLGRITAPVIVPGGEGPLDLRQVGAVPDALPWQRFKRPESGDFLIYLWRNPAGRSWNDVLSLIVPDGSTAAPAGTIRITNLFPASIRFVWNETGVLLPGGKSIVRTITPGEDIPFQILMPDSSGGLKRYYSGAATQNPGERGFITIYRADGAAPRRPVKVSMLREPVGD